MVQTLWKKEKRVHIQNKEKQGKSEENRKR